jgi:lipopolysaccharide/colanic/teichoic acid biosynthesis glycosyltransferase
MRVATGKQKRDLTRKQDRRVPQRAEWEPLPPRDGYERAKTAFDRVFALSLLLVAAPVMLLAALLVKLTSRGPVLYSQTRLGRDGTPFRLFKIRSMIHDCESLTGARWCLPGDPRITPVGHVLRRTHLDEFPQLWNVLRGEMSLVGPRPERPEMVPGLEGALPDYRRRLAVRPGLTGLAQVHLPPDTDLDSVARKLVYDLYYVRNAAFWLDVRLVIVTGLATFGMPYSVVCKLFRIPGPGVVEPVQEAAGGDLQLQAA